MHLCTCTVMLSLLSLLCHKKQIRRRTVCKLQPLPVPVYMDPHLIVCSTAFSNCTQNRVALRCCIMEKSNPRIVFPLAIV
ncbi:hypothetical protein BKA67DRAFT_574564, partial [Truncatella angustata]